MSQQAIVDTKAYLYLPTMRGILDNIEESPTQIKKMLLTAELLQGIAKNPQIIKKNPHVHEALRNKMDEMFTFAYAKTQDNTTESMIAAATTLMCSVVAIQLLL